MGRQCFTSTELLTKDGLANNHPQQYERGIDDMSTSFKLDGGDLVVGSGRSFERVSGAYKLAQDLRLWVLERIGTDPATPTFGSRLDGGVIDGESIEPFIGHLGSESLLSEIRSEVSTLLGQFQQQQIAKMKSDMLLNDGKTTLTAEEILHVVNSIEATQVATQVIIRVNCTTLAGSTFRLLIPTTQA